MVNYAGYNIKQIYSDTLLITNLISGTEYEIEVEVGKRRRWTEIELLGFLKMWTERKWAYAIRDEKKK